MHFLLNLFYLVILLFMFKCIYPMFMLWVVHDVFFLLDFGLYIFFNILPFLSFIRFLPFLCCFAKTIFLFTCYSKPSSGNHVHTKPSHWPKNMNWAFLLVQKAKTKSAVGTLTTTKNKNLWKFGLRQETIKLELITIGRKKASCMITILQKTWHHKIRYKLKMLKSPSRNHLQRISDFKSLLFCTEKRWHLKEKLFTLFISEYNENSVLKFNHWLDG